MFSNGFFGLFKSSQQEEEPRTQQPTWNATTMAMEQPANYAGSQQTTSQSSQEEQQMKLRGGAGCFDVCCGCFAGLCAFECLEDCC
jgi:hypothetical protein